MPTLLQLICESIGHSLPDSLKPITRIFNEFVRDESKQLFYKRGHHECDGSILNLDNHFDYHMRKFKRNWMLKKYSNSHFGLMVDYASNRQNQTSRHEDELIGKLIYDKSSSQRIPTSDNRSLIIFKKTDSSRKTLNEVLSLFSNVSLRQNEIQFYLGKVVRLPARDIHGKVEAQNGRSYSFRRSDQKDSSIFLQIGQSVKFEIIRDRDNVVKAQRVTLVNETFAALQDML